MSHSRSILPGLIRPFRDLLSPAFMLRLRCNADGSRALRLRFLSRRHTPRDESRFALPGDSRQVNLGRDHFPSCRRLLFRNRGSLQSIVHQLKYNGMTSLGRLLGEQLGERVLEELAGEKITGITPVPLHFSKKRERG